MRRLRSAAAALLLALSAACAAKTAPVPPPSAAPRFPEFVFPTPPAGVGTPAALERHDVGWQWLQAGDLRAAERNFQAALKQSPDFYPAHAALGWVALAKKDEQEALTAFDRAVVANPRYAPALAGRGQTLTALGETELALKSLEAAVAADPALEALNSRIEVLRFNTVKERIAAARKAAEAGRFADARAEYARAIAASPQSPFLYRELGLVERREGNLTAALTHAQKAAELEPGDPRNLVVIAEIYEAQGQLARAADTYAAANVLEPNESLEAKVEELRERAAFATMPAEYQAIEDAATVTRAQLAALLGVRLDALLKRSGRGGNAVLITDLRGNWAAPWIMAVARARLMDAYSNHTFQPQATVRRSDLANAAARALALIAAENPRLGASWKDARRKFTDLSPGHLHYAAASVAVEAGVMTTMPDGSFQQTRPVTGAEAVAAVRKLQALSERRRR
jgi:tetratricopeptide (TPR) repeat protein